MIVLENRGAIEAFGRSRELVRGHGWNVFGDDRCSASSIGIVGRIVVSIALRLAARFARSASQSLVANT